MSETKFDSNKKGSNGTSSNSLTPEQVKNLETNFGGPDSEQVAAQKKAETDALDEQFNAPSAQGVGANRGSTPAPEITPHRDAFPSGPKEDAIPQKNDGFYKNGKSDTKAENAKNLTKRENEAGEDLYTGGDEDKKEKKKGFWNKKKTAAAGGIAGIALGGGLLGLTSVLGPLEFVHLAQNLHASHFAQQEEGDNGRLGKLFRFARSGGNFGETRLGYLSSKYHAKIMGKLSAIGFEPSYSGALNTYDGMTIDTEHEKSPYRGMSNEEVIKTIEAKTGITPQVGADGKLKIDAAKFWDQKASLKFALNDLGDRSVTTALRSRVLAKFGMVTFHPLKIADKKLNNTTAKIGKYFKDQWKNRVTNGVEPTPTIEGKAKLNPDGTPVTDPATGKAVTEPLSSTEATQAAAAIAPDKASGILKSLAQSKAAGVVGGVAGVAAVTCALKGVDDSLPAIRYAQIILPAMRMALDMMTLGYQLPSNQDVETAELKYLSQYLNQYDASGKLVSTWTGSQAYHASAGQSGGVAMSSETRNLADTSQSKVSWLAWTQNAFFDGLCSTIGSAITGVVSITLGVLSGGTIQTIVGFVGGALVGPPLIAKATSLVSGQGLNILGLRGAQWHSALDGVGGVAGANQQSVQFGGNALAAKAAYELNQQTIADQQTDFSQKSFFARAFDPKDYRSLTARLIDSQTTSVATNTAVMLQGALTTVGSLLTMPMKLFSSTVHAAPAYVSPLPTVGFSLAEDANPAVENPYAVADAVAPLLDGDTGSADGYIARAANCYGNKLVKTADTHADGTVTQDWDAIPTNMQADGKTPINIYDPTYKTFHCDDTSTQWLQVRYFIRDTGVMEGYACADLEDATSCTNDGVGAANTTAGASTSAVDTATITPTGCQGSVTGAQRIICGAYLFDPYGYNNQPSAGRRVDEPGLINDVLQGKIPAGTNILDCSALVDAAIFYAYGVDLHGAATASYPSQTTVLQEIPLADAQPGDIAWWDVPDGHSEVIVSYDKASGLFHTFGSHMNYADVTKDISAATYPSSGTWAVRKVYRVVKPAGSTWVPPTAASPAK